MIQILLGDHSKQHCSGCEARSGLGGNLTRASWGQVCRHTRAFDRSRSRVVHQPPGRARSLEANRQHSRRLPSGSWPSEPPEAPAAGGGPTRPHAACPEHSTGWGPSPAPGRPFLLRPVNLHPIQEMLPAPRRAEAEPGDSPATLVTRVCSVSFPGFEDCPVPAPVPRGVPAPRGIRLHCRHAAVSAGLRHHLRRAPEVRPALPLAFEGKLSPALT